MNIPFNIPYPLAIAFAVLMWLVTIVVHITFAVGVFSDAQKLAPSGRRCRFVEPFVWMLAVLLGGVVPAALYWALHHSTLCREPGA